MNLRAHSQLVCIGFSLILAGACQHDAPAPASAMPSGQGDPPASPAPNKPAAGSAPSPATASQCTADSDCRLVDDYCEACRCQALPVGAPDPVCHVTHVECFVAPCRGKRALCRTGECSVFDQANGEM